MPPGFQSTAPPETRQLPKPGPADRPFWAAAKRHQLVLPRCGDCRNVWFPPYACCPRCLSANVEWITASGKGSLYGWIEMYKAYLPAFADKIPYNVVLVRLEEGPLMFGTLVDTAWEEMRADMPVVVEFEDVTEEISLPRFRANKH